MSFISNYKQSLNCKLDLFGFSAQIVIKSSIGKVWHRSLSLSLRSLCVDALIELSDENADWKLSLTEFVNCLTPTYHPYERSNDTNTHTLLKCQQYTEIKNIWIQSEHIFFRDTLLSLPIFMSRLCEKNPSQITTISDCVCSSCFSYASIYLHVLAWRVRSGGWSVWGWSWNSDGV